MEIRGFTAVDSLYEYFGYQTGSEFYELLSSMYLPAMLAIAGLCLIFYRSIGRGNWGAVVGYLIYIAVALWLTSPTTVGVGPTIIESEGDETYAFEKPDELSAPRFLAYTHILTDNVVRLGVTKADPNFRRAAHHWVRLAAATKSARIWHPELRQRFAYFITDCYMPALARYENTDNTIYPTQEPAEFLKLYENRTGTHYVEWEHRVEYVGCLQLRESLRERLIEHVEHDYHHKKLIDSYTKGKTVKTPSGDDPFETKIMSRDQFRDYYLRRLIYNETFYRNDLVDQQLVDKAIPEYHWYDTSQNTHGYASDGKKDWLDTAWQRTKSMASSAIRGIAGIKEWIDQQAAGPMLYYRVTLYAPYIYGLVLMILIVAWPIPAIWCLWPSSDRDHPWNFRPLLNYLKIFISVKLWPFFWALLASFNSARQWLPGEDGTQGGEMYHAFSAIAAMYIVVPAFSFLIIQLTTKAGGSALSSFGSIGASGGGVGNIALLGAGRVVGSGSGAGAKASSGAASGGARKAAGSGAKGAAAV